MDWLDGTLVEPALEGLTLTEPALEPTNPSSLTLALIGVATIVLFRLVQRIRSAPQNAKLGGAAGRTHHPTALRSAEPSDGDKKRRVA